MTSDLPSVPWMSVGKRVLIAGASGGIGQEVLRLLVQSEVWIGAHYFQEERKLRSVVDDYRDSSVQFKLFQADLNTAEASQGLIQRFVDWAGGIDVLVQLTGGINRPVRWDVLTETDWEHDLAVNLKGPFFLAQAAMLHMRGAGGKVILTSTASAKHGGGANSVAYGVSKAGIEFLTKALARVGAPYEILVNAVCPGFIETSIHTVQMRRSAEQLRKRAELVPLKRAGTPQEVAGLIVFLASEWGNYITGECISVSGGDYL